MIADVGAYLVFFFVVALYYALLCLGLNLPWGVTGLFNVGVAGFVAVGAYGSGRRVPSVIATAPQPQSTPANSFARANTSSSIPGVSRPVKVFCWLTW